MAGAAEFPHQDGAGLESLAALIPGPFLPERRQKPQGGLVVPAKGLFLDPPSQGPHQQVTPQRRGRRSAEFRSPGRLEPPQRQAGKAVNLGRYCFGRWGLGGSLGAPAHDPNHAPFARHVQSDSMSRCDIPSPTTKRLAGGPQAATRSKVPIFLEPRRRVLACAGNRCAKPHLLQAPHTLPDVLAKHHTTRRSVRSCV